MRSAPYLCVLAHLKDCSLQTECARMHEGVFTILALTQYSTQGVFYHLWVGTGNIYLNISCSFTGQAKMWAEDDFPPPSRPRLVAEPSDGGVYTMYHGTTKEAAASIKKSGFKPSKDGMLGQGVYLSRDLEKASRYPLELPENQRVVIRVKVKVGKVKKIDHQGHPLQKTWHNHGYDTAWCPPRCGMVRSGLEEDCVWDPNRITFIDVIHPRLGAGGGCGAARGSY